MITYDGTLLARINTQTQHIKTHNHNIMTRWPNFPHQVLLDLH